MTLFEFRAPEGRPLIWPDTVLELTRRLVELNLPPMYLVGGCVRDAYWHRPVKDVDFVVERDAIRVSRIITDAFDGDIYIMDRERGVVRIFVTIEGDTLTVDVAEFRGETLADDLRGRDFTVNAIAVPLQSELTEWYDPLDGETDLKRRVLRLCADDALSHDPLRIMRGIRQSIKFSMHILPATLQSMKQNSSELATVTAERIRDEWVQWMLLPQTDAALRIGHHIGVLPTLYPEIVNHDNVSSSDTEQSVADETTLAGNPLPIILSVVQQIERILQSIRYTRTDSTSASFDMGMLVVQFDRYRRAINDHLEQLWPNDRPHSYLVKFAAMPAYALIQDGNKVDAQAAISQFMQRANAFRLSQNEISTGKMMLTCAAQFQSGTFDTALEQHRYWYRAGAQGIDGIIIALAMTLSEAGYRLKQADWLVLIDRATRLMDAYFMHHDTIVAPPLLVDGVWLIETFSLMSGPVIGDLLTRIREGQVTGELSTIDDVEQMVTAYLADADRSGIE